jgi:type I restriction enzyme R subunit
MIATGTDVKPLEVLLFMRDVKSINYFEQMKGRGTRTIDFNDLKKVSRTAKHNKTHFVIMDAVGATKSKKTDSRPLERKRGVPMKDLLNAVAFGARDEDLFTSLANRLIRLEKQLSDKEKEEFRKKANGKSINQVVSELLESFHPDTEEQIKEQVGEEKRGAAPMQIDKAIEEQLKKKRNEAASVFTGEFNEFVENVRKQHDQIIDNINTDRVLRAEWDSYSQDKAKEVTESFEAYIKEHKDEITALSLFYGQPYKRKELTYKMIKDLLEKLKKEKPLLSPNYVWEAYEQLEDVQGSNPKNELVALVSLIRKVTKLDEQLTPYNKVVDQNFQKWVFEQNAGEHNKFTEEQMKWLRMLKEHIAISFHVDEEDFEYDPFNKYGGIGKFYQLFEEDYKKVIEELNEVLVA